MVDNGSNDVLIWSKLGGHGIRATHDDDNDGDDGADDDTAATTGGKRGDSSAWCTNDKMFSDGCHTGATTVGMNTGDDEDALADGTGDVVKRALAHASNPAAFLLFFSCDLPPARA